MLPAVSTRQRTSGSTPACATWALAWQQRRSAPYVPGIPRLQPTGAPCAGSSQSRASVAVVSHGGALLPPRSSAARLPGGATRHHVALVEGERPSGHAPPSVLTLGYRRGAPSDAPARADSTKITPVIFMALLTTTRYAVHGARLGGADPRRAMIQPVRMLGPTPASGRGAAADRASFRRKPTRRLLTAMSCRLNRAPAEYSAEALDRRPARSRRSSRRSWSAVAADLARATARTASTPTRFPRWRPRWRSAMGTAPSSRYDEALRNAYEQVMVILFRLLFVAYAEG